MRITIDESPGILETEVIIKCKEVSSELQRLIAMIKNSEERIIGVLDGTTHFIEPKDILYFESVDKRTFIYTKVQVFETHLRLYELENRLEGHDFFRASKSTIINFPKITKLSPKFNGKLDVLLENGEKLTVSRQYVPVLKEILDL
jgi:DNA-binding LytR/AlgR family response regulator